MRGPRQDKLGTIARKGARLIGPRPPKHHTLHAEAVKALRFVFRDIEALAEALDASGGVQNALRASIVRMALGADINTQGALGAADLEGVAARAGDVRGLIHWMDS